MGQAKIVSLDDLAKITADLRGKGETIVLAHGVFDLLHLGHVHHLQSARKEGTVLVVTITADRFIIKGPGRPVFSSDARAAMLASLECVDYVAVHNGPSAEDVIHALRPNVYVKGAEYANPDDDLTGKIAAEKDAVEQSGGKLVLTNDPTYSSSTLINRYLDVYDPPLREYLDGLRRRVGSDQLLGAFNQATGQRALIVGDSIIDEYLYVTPLGKAPKENMIATQLRDGEIFAGGVVAAANTLAGFCSEVEILTVLGGDESHEELIRASLKPNVTLTVLTRPGMPTTKKTRYVESTYVRKLFEVYTMDDSPLAGDIEAELIAQIEEKAAQYDLTIVTDFGHGMITPPVVRALERSAKFLAVNTQSNSANFGYNLITKFSRADYISIDAPEARLASGEKSAEIESTVIPKIRAKVSCSNFVITHGGHGCYTFDQDGKTVRVPAFTKSVVDTVGAGDAFFVVTAPMVSAGLPMELVGVIGNCAGALKVGIVGHRRSVERVPLQKFLVTLLK